MATVKEPKEVKSSKEVKMPKEVKDTMKPVQENVETPTHTHFPESQKGSPIASAIIMSGILVSFSIFLHAYILKGVSLPGFKNLGAKTQEQGTNVKTAPTDDTLIPENPGAKVDVSIDDDAVKGNKDAKVTIVEFSDFQCPFCERFYSDAYKSIIKDYVDSGKVKVVFRDYPLSFHANAQVSAEASECAADQGKFWEMHDKLFETQSEWSELSNELAKGKFGEYAAQLGLNTGNFNSCLSTGKQTEEVKKDMAEGTKYGVSGTPTVFVNGIKLVGAQPYSVFKQAIDDELNK